MLLPTFLPLLLLSTTTALAAYTPPSPILPNGATNPFYPCPATHPSSCPFRCYLAPPGQNFTTHPPTLLPTCYSASDAASLLSTSTHICLRCLLPLQKELPASASAPETCQPLLPYFNTSSGPSASPAPSRCGFEPHHRLPACAWECAEAQVPFSVCAARNESGTYSVCERCLPQCSTPRVVFEPPKLPAAFSLSNGSCEAGVVGVACPWRCVDSGSSFAYCSLLDRTAEFTTCTAC